MARRCTRLPAVHHATRRRAGLRATICAIAGALVMVPYVPLHAQPVNNDYYKGAGTELLRNVEGYHLDLARDELAGGNRLFQCVEGGGVGAVAHHPFAFRWDHEAERVRLQSLMDAGLTVLCCRCHKPIQPGQRWSPDHDADRTGYLGASHERCNLRAAGLASHGLDWTPK